MGEPYRIRAASSADLGAIALIERVAFADPWSIDALAAHLADHFLVAKSGATVVGYVVAREIGDAAEVLNVAVAPARRRQGIARALVQHVLDELRGAGCRMAFLEVRPSNDAARAVYAALGFRPVGRRPGYYRAPHEDALVLGLTLAPVGEEATEGEGPHGIG